MLYKPTSPSPYIAPIDPANDDGVKFACSCANTNDITGVRLILKNGLQTMYYPISVDNAETYYPALNITDNKIEITANININYRYTDTTDNSIYNGYKVYPYNTSKSLWQRKGFEETLSSNGVICNDSSATLKGFLQSPRQYNWQIRLYEDNCSTNIGYGFIEEIITDTEGVSAYGDESNFYGYDGLGTSHILKIRPHTDIQFPLLEKSDDEIDYDEEIMFNRVLPDSGVYSQYTVNYDTMAKYMININGSFYKIKAYYYGRGADDTGNDFDDQILEGSVDSYGNPLYAFVEVYLPIGDEISVGDEYTIYSNYIDSDEFQFPCKSTPKLTLSDGNKEIDDFVEGTNISEDTNAYYLRSSNLQLTGEYKQDDGAVVSYYWIKLYQKTNTGDYLLIDDTTNLYSTKIEYNYDCFLNEEEYKLIICVVDSNKTSILRTLKIVPSYSGAIIPVNVMVDPDRRNGSICIDFSSLISISGEESISGTATLASEELTINETTYQISYCDVGKNNTITFYKQDGTDRVLQCTSPLLSFVCRCTHKLDQQIVTLNADNGKTYELYWTGYSFIYKVYRNDYSLQDDEYNPYGEYNSDSIQKALEQETVSYEVPFIAYDDISWIDTSYYQTSNVFNDFWWKIVITDSRLYIQCLNPPSNTNNMWSYDSNNNITDGGEA